MFSRAPLRVVRGERQHLVDPRRATENIFLSAEGRGGRGEHLFVREVTRRAAKNTKGVSDFVCAAVQRLADQSRFAPVNRCSGERERALVSGRAKTGSRSLGCKIRS